MGEIDDPATLPIIFEAPADSDWKNEAVWHLVNPDLRHGYPVATLRQEWVTQSPALNELERVILAGRFLHGGHRVLRWCFDNVAIHTDSTGNRAMHKGKSTDRTTGRWRHGWQSRAPSLARRSRSTTALRGLTRWRSFRLKWFRHGSTNKAKRKASGPMLRKCLSLLRKLERAKGFAPSPPTLASKKLHCQSIRTEYRRFHTSTKESAFFRYSSDWEAVNGIIIR